MKDSSLLFIPNIFNYFRLFLLLISPFTNYFISIYILTSFFDLIDGTIARYFKQTSLLGKCLDMFTDRIATVILVAKIFIQRQDEKIQSNKKENSYQHESNNLKIDKKNSKITKFFESNNYILISLIIDILAHNFFFIANFYDHKDTNNFFLKIYYFKPILIFCCVSTELYYVFIYLKKNIHFFILGMMMRNFFNLVSLVEGIRELGNMK